MNLDVIYLRVYLSENAEILVDESIQNLRNLLGELYPRPPAMDILQLCTNLVDFQTNLDIKMYILSLALHVVWLKTT